MNAVNSSGTRFEYVLYLYVLGFGSGSSFVTTNNEKWKQHRENASTMNSELEKYKNIMMKSYTWWKTSYLTRVDEGIEVKIANGKPKPKK